MIGWAAPADGGRPIESYEVRWRTADPQGQWSTVAGLPADRLAYRAHPLRPDTEYSVQVRAVNGDGSSPRSDTASLTTEGDDRMTILQSDLTRVQAAIATADGTHRASTMRIPFVSGTITPQIQRKTLEERAGLLADSLDIVTMRGTQMQLTTELDTETILLPLLCGLSGGATATAQSSAQNWTFTPAVTAPSELKTASFELAETDGSTSSYRRQFELCRPTEIGIEASGDTSQLSVTWAGRAAKPLATPAQAPTPARHIVPAAAWSLYLDDTWAGLGTTKIGSVRSLSMTIDPGLTPAEAVDGREDLDVSYWRRGRIRGALTVVADHDADTTGELAHWEDGDLRYARMEYTSGTNASRRAIRIDLVMRYIASPDVLSMDDSIHTLSLAGQLRADSDGRILSIRVTNALTAT